MLEVGICSASEASDCGSACRLSRFARDPAGQYRSGTTGAHGPEELEDGILQLGSIQPASRVHDWCRSCDLLDARALRRLEREPIVVSFQGPAERTGLRRNLARLRASLVG